MEGTEEKEQRTGRGAEAGRGDTEKETGKGNVRRYLCDSGHMLVQTHTS